MRGEGVCVGCPFKGLGCEHEVGGELEGTSEPRKHVLFWLFLKMSDIKK